MTFRPYIPAYPPCAGRALPGTAHLQLAILERFDASYDAGIYNCRPSSGNPNVPSIHSDGRAGDVGFPKLHAQGYWLVARLRAAAWDLGLMGIIWDRKRYDWRTPWGREYTGPDDHRTHVHYEQEPTLAATLTLSQARYQIGEPEPMSFTPQEETALKKVAMYADFLAPFAAGIMGPGPTTGRQGNYLSLLHVLEVHRVVADKTGVNPTDHLMLAARLLGQ